MIPLPPAATENHIKTSVGRLRILQAGNPAWPPMLLLHGGGSDSAAVSWYRLIAPLAARYRVIAPDLPGFGGSIDIAPVGGPQSMAAVAAEILDHLDAAPAIVAGVSMGGDVALNLALAYPDHVAALVLVAPGGLVADLGRAQPWAWRVANLPDWLLIPAGRLANRFAGAALKAMMADPARLPPQAAAAFVRNARHPRGALGYLRYNQATLGQRGMRNDLTGRVAEIPVPALFFHGAKDRMVPPDASRRAARRMPDAQMVLVPDCGHLVQIEAHDLFLSTLQGFLDARQDRLPKAARSG